MPQLAESNQLSHEEVKAVVEGASSAKELVELLYNSERLRELLIFVPPQSLYAAIQEVGYDACVELITRLPVEQYRALLDFELWERDRFSEEKFWDWFLLIEDPTSHSSLAQLVLSIDPKILALLTTRHVQAVMLEDASDNPPDGFSHSPDNGFTWLNITIEHPEHKRILGKLLAYIFETNAAMFYQLIAMPLSATCSELEEEAYEEQQKRLVAEGVPTFDDTLYIHAPLAPGQAACHLRDRGVGSEIPYQRVTALVSNDGQMQPLSGLIATLSAEPTTQAAVEGELSFITNAAIVFYGVPFHNRDAVLQLIRNVRGAINIGLEVLVEETQRSTEELYDQLHLSGMYRVGLHSFIALQKNAAKLYESSGEMLASTNPALAVLVEYTRHRMPELPAFYEEGVDVLEADVESIDLARTPFCHIRDVREVTALLADILDELGESS